MTSAQPAIRQRARELLAAEYDRLGDPEIARALRDNLGGFFEPSLRALEAALTSCHRRARSDGEPGLMACKVCTVVRNVWDRFAAQRARRDARRQSARFNGRDGNGYQPRASGQPGTPPGAP